MSSTVFVLDDFYLGITVLVALGFQVVGFAIAFSLQTDIIQDAWSAVTFALLALLTYGLGATHYTRQNVVLAFVLVWAIRLGGFQIFRISKMGGDARFDDMRGKLTSLAGFWTAQWLWTWIVSLPVIILNSPAISVPTTGGDVPFGTSKDIVGVILWVLGFTIEASADFLKYYWKNGHRHPKGAIIDIGPWAWSRRANYFGEILVWLGIYLLAISPATDRPTPLVSSSRSALLGSVVSPLFTFVILMFLSGVPTAEKPTQQRAFLASHGPDAEEETSEPLQPYKKQRETDPWMRYKAFRERTSLLIPIPPALYAHLPQVVKRTVLMDWGMYRFDEAKDGPKAIKEAREKKERNQS